MWILCDIKWLHLHLCFSLHLPLPCSGKHTHTQGCSLGHFSTVLVPNTDRILCQMHTLRSIQAYSNTPWSVSKSIFLHMTTQICTVGHTALQLQLARKKPFIRRKKQGWSQRGGETERTMKAELDPNWSMCLCQNLWTSFPPFLFSPGALTRRTSIPCICLPLHRSIFTNIQEVEEQNAEMHWWNTHELYLGNRSKFVKQCL